jgi:hypothetical protein
MSFLRSVSLPVVALLSLVWIVAWGAVLSGPFVRADRWMSETAAQTGIAAVSFSLASVLWRLLVVFIPPLVVFVGWLIARRAA